MEQKLIIKKAETGPNKGDIIIYLTDIQLHSGPKKTSSVGKVIKDAVDHHTAGRIYSPLDVDNIERNNTFTIDLIRQDPSLLKMIQEYQSQGKRVFIKKPEGLPVFPGPDTLEFMASKNGQRIIRNIEKTICE